MEDALARVRSELAAAELWLAGESEGARPGPEILATFFGGDAETLVLAAQLAVRLCGAAILAGDAPARRRAAELAQQLVQNDAPQEAVLRAQFAASLEALGVGDAPTDAVLAKLEADARERNLAAFVVDVASLRAMAQAEHGDWAGGLVNARRASLMARTEGLALSEYLAGIALARLRRLGGRPYLAAGIATALRRSASPPWHPRIDWELGLAGGGVDIPLALGAAADLPLLFEHARAGDRARFDQATARLMAATDGFATERNDVIRLLDAIDPNRDPSDAAPPLRRWILGLDGFASPPFGLAGLIASEDGMGAMSGVGMVVVRTDRPSRRVLRAGLGLALLPADGRCLDDANAGRPEAVLCALALAGPDGVDEAGLFRAVYGFDYVARTHRGTFDVALHRARVRLAELGQIERGDGRLRLAVAHAFVVVDPRSAAEIDDRVFALVARSGKISARDAAQTLNVPLRTVQTSLRDLVDNGACVQERAGRAIAYVVEDTAFQDPTLTRRS